MKKRLIILLLVLVALTACETRIIMEQPGVAPQNVISVQGSSEFEVAPDLARIRFGIVSESSTAQAAQIMNREISSSADAALRKVGIRKSEVETTGYRVEKIQEWDSNLRKSVVRGYRVRNTFVVSTKDLDKVGDILDAGVQAGANNVESIQFLLSDEKQIDAKTEALRKATKNAREKADALAQGASVRLGKLRSLSENSFVVTPYARAETMMMKAGMDEGMASPTEISPQSVQVSAQVSASYDIA